jgi:hypothetical protein
MDDRSTTNPVSRQHPDKVGAASVDQRPPTTANYGYPGALRGLQEALSSCAAASTVGRPVATGVLAARCRRWFSLVCGVQVCSLYRRVCEGCTRKPRLVLPATVYIACRMNLKPYTLMDIAESVCCDVFKLGRAARDIEQQMHFKLKQLDPALLVERVCGVFRPEIEKAVRADKIKILRVGRQALCVLDAARADSLIDGRAPGAVAAAAALVAMQANNVNIPLARVAACMRVAERTVAAREAELRATLLRLAGQLPWGRHVTAETLSHHMRTVLDSLPLLVEMDAEARSGSVVGPPSFQREEAARLDRAGRIIRAARRLRTKSKGAIAVDTAAVEALCVANDSASQGDGADATTDREDLLIETLLLRGVSTSLILGGVRHVASCAQPVGDDDPVELTPAEEATYIRTEAEVQELKRRRVEWDPAALVAAVPAPVLGQ